MDKEKLKFLGNSTLETERLIMRKLQASDAQDMFEYASNPEVAKYTLWEAHKSIADAEQFIQWTLERYQRDEAGEWAILLKTTDKIIGTVGMVQFDLQNSCASIGYALAKEHWGKGIVPEAVARLIQFGFEELGLNRIEAVHIPENEASGRVMQKVGMSFEGLLRQRMYAREKYWDVRQYAILKKEWMRAQGGNK